MGSRKGAWGAAALVVAAITGECALAQAPQRVTGNSGVADSAAVRFSIPAQPLAPALASFGNAADLQILYTADVARNMRTNGVQGTFSKGEALRRLLAGTGLAYRFTNASTVTIESSGSRAGAAPVSGAIALDTIDVQGATSSDPGKTEGTGSYTPSVTTSATRLQLTPRETPQSISVITRQHIDDFRLNMVDDVMQHTPGISTVTRDHERVEYFARGFRISNFQDDGMPGHRDDNGFPAGETLSDMAMYDRVEVLKGANGLLTGSGEPGATINLVRKKPTKNFQGHTTLNGDSWGTYRGELDLSSPLNESGTVRGRFVTTYQDRKSHLDHFLNKSSLFYGVIEADLTPDTLLTVGAHHQDDAPRGSAYGSIPLLDSNGNFNATRRSFNPGARWSRREQTSHSIFTSLEHHFDNEWRVKLYLKRQVNGFDAKLASLSDGTPNPLDGSGTSLWAGSWLGKTQLDVAEAYATGPLHLFGRTHEVVLGGTISNRHWTNETADPDPSFNYNFPDFYNWNGDIPEPAWVSNLSWDKQVARNRAAYAAIKLNPHDRLKLLAGSRVAQYDGLRTSPARNDQFTKSVVVPYFGAIVDLNEHLSLYASHTGIFRPQYVQTEQGNTLPPEEGISNEVGLKAAFFEGRLNANAAYFHVKQDNFAIATGGRTPSGNPAYQAVDGVITKGFELEVSGQLSPQWQIQAGFTHKISRREDIKVATLTPENQFTLYTTYKLDGALDGLTVGGGARWQSETWGIIEFPIWSGNYLTHVAKSWWVVDLMASYKFTDNLSATLNVRNLFDRSYYSIYDYYSTYTWGAPRSINLSMTYKF